MKEKNNFLTHRFLPLLSIFTLCLFILCTSCFASSDYYIENEYFVNNVDNERYKINSSVFDYKYIYLNYLGGDDKTFVVFCSNSEFYFDYNYYDNGTKYSYPSVFATTEPVYYYSTYLAYSANVVNLANSVPSEKYTVITTCYSGVPRSWCKSNPKWFL